MEKINNNGQLISIRKAEQPVTLNPYQPDIQLFLVLIPLINIINYYLTYPDIKLNGFFLLTFSIDTAQGYAAWLGVRALILYLDRKWPYQKAPLKRIIIQLVCTTFIGLFIISLLTEIVSLLATAKPAPLHFYTHILLIIGIWFLVVNGIYIGLYFYNEWQRAESRHQEKAQPESQSLIVRSGRKEIKIRLEELRGFYVEEDYIIACNKDGKKFYLDHSLDKLEKMVPGDFFFRLNRQYLVHREIVIGFKRAENGKIIVLLNQFPPFPSGVPVSRTKAPAFKVWFRPD